MSEVLKLKISEAENGMRLDKALAALAPEYSRARMQALIQEGHVQVNALDSKDASRKVRTGSVVTVDIPEAQAANPEAEDIPLDIVFEDEHMLVINKPAGLVVHPGAGNHTGTLVNALLHHCGDSLSGIGGVLRPGIVHRLDKDTSGLMVVAKNDTAHQGLSAQLADRSLSRVYDALVLGVPVPIKGVIDKHIGRDGKNRLRMSVHGQNGKEARTHYLVTQNYNEALSLVECKLESGRTHQIRVHMQYIKHCLIGDPLYGPQETAIRSNLNKAGYEDTVEAVLAFPRQALHARAISFIHPVSKERHSYEAARPDDLSKLLNLFNK